MLSRPQDEAVQKALVFVSRCQNLESENNTTPFSAKINDGGFYYTPAAGGTSQAGKSDNGGLRSYGSMTYAGLKSMIFAGLTADDPRVKAALSWLARHYTLDENPGLGDAGLYYYSIRRSPERSTQPASNNSRTPPAQSMTGDPI